MARWTGGEFWFDSGILRRYNPDYLRISPKYGHFSHLPLKLSFLTGSAATLGVPLSPGVSGEETYWHNKVSRPERVEDFAAAAGRKLRVM